MIKKGEKKCKKKKDSGFCGSGLREGREKVRGETVKIKDQRLKIKE